MRNPNLALQNLGPEMGRVVPLRAGRPSFQHEERTLSPFETDRLLSSTSPFARRNRRTLTEFRDNHSGGYRLFHIY